MDSSRRPFDNVIASGEAVARAVNVPAAVEPFLAGARRLFGADTILFQHTEGGWVAVAGADHKSERPLPDLAAALRGAEFDDLPQLVPGPTASDPWTIASVRVPEGPRFAILVPGDWDGAGSVLHAFAATMTLALTAVCERDRRRRDDRAIGTGYIAARRLTRLDGVGRVYQRIVDAAAGLLDAERVSLAMYRPADDCLAIEAVSGYPFAVVQGVRIDPGSWVIGHVFSTGRPVLVHDVREVEGMASGRPGYRTHSFVAVPLRAGSQIIGVLTATDKRSRPTFDRQDMRTLRIVAVTAALAIVAARSHEEASRLSYAATVDSLTGLHNRPYLDERLHQEVERARRGGYTLAVLMADIDDFKVINDSFGHPRGDAVLQAIGGILRSAVRVFDVCARYGGDEFAILMPSSDASNAAACGERIRRRVSDYKSEQHVPRLPSLTMSIGVAITMAGESAADVILRADRALYEAKASGKNRVCLHAGSDAPPFAPAAERHKESM